MRTLATYLICMSVASSAAAQVAIGGTAGVSAQSGSGLSGSALGGVFFLDRGISGRLTVGGEASLADEISGRDRQFFPDGDITFDTQHHDSRFSGIVKARAVDWQRLHIGPALGLGAAWRHTSRQGVFRQYANPSNSQLVRETLSDVVLAATVGFDASITFGPRAALVWTGRMHFLHDDDRDEHGDVRRGVASNVFRFGGGARLAF
jgi:hypothetical protein